MCDPLYDPETVGKKVKAFRDANEVLLAMRAGGSYNTANLTDGEQYDDFGRGLHLHERIKLRFPMGLLKRRLDGFCSIRSFQKISVSKTKPSAKADL